MIGAGARGPPTEPIAGGAEGVSAGATDPMTGAGVSAGATDPMAGAAETDPIAGAGPRAGASAGATDPMMGAGPGTGTAAGATQPAAADAPSTAAAVVTSRSGVCGGVGCGPAAAGPPEVATNRRAPAAGTGGTGATAAAWTVTGAVAGAIGDVISPKVVGGSDVPRARRPTRRPPGNATGVTFSRRWRPVRRVRPPRGSRAVPGSWARPHLEQPCAV